MGSSPGSSTNRFRGPPRKEESLDLGPEKGLADGTRYPAYWMTRSSTVTPLAGGLMAP